MAVRRPRFGGLETFRCVLDVKLRKMDLPKLHVMLVWNFREAPIDVVSKMLAPTASPLVRVEAAKGLLDELTEGKMTVGQLVQNGVVPALMAMLTPPEGTLSERGTLLTRDSHAIHTHYSHALHTRFHTRFTSDAHPVLWSCALPCMPIPRL